MKMSLLRFLAVSIGLWAVFVLPVVLVLDLDGGAAFLLGLVVGVFGVFTFRGWILGDLV